MLDILRLDPADKNSFLCVYSFDQDDPVEAELMSCDDDTDMEDVEITELSNLYKQLYPDSIEATMDAEKRELKRKHKEDMNEMKLREKTVRIQLEIAVPERTRKDIRQQKTRAVAIPEQVATKEE